MLLSVLFKLDDVNLNAWGQLLRAACLQNETAPEKLLNRYEKWFEKREKKIRKTIRNATEKTFSPSQAA